MPDCLPNPWSHYCRASKAVVGRLGIVALGVATVLLPPGCNLLLPPAEVSIALRHPKTIAT